MKSMKVAMAAIIVAALMVIPIALFAVGDDSSSTGPINPLNPYDELDFPEVDWKKLMEIDFSEASTPGGTETYTGAITVDPGDYLYMNQDFVLNKNSTVTFLNGSYMTICPAQAFSISAPDAYAGIIFMAGSHITITTDGNDPDFGEDGNVVCDTVVEETTSIYFAGKMTFTKAAGLDFTVTVDKSSQIVDSMDVKQRDVTINFPEENEINMKATVTTDTTNKKTTVAAEIHIAADIASPIEEDVYATVKGGFDYTVDAIIPHGSTSTVKDLSVHVKGNGTYAADAGAYYTASLTNDTDVTYKILNYDTETAKSTMTGYVNIDMTTTDMDNKEIQEDPAIYVTSKGNSASMKFSFNDTKVTADVSVGIDKYQIREVLETGDNVTSVEGIKISAKYAGTTKEATNAPVTGLKLMGLATSTPQVTPASVKDDMFKEYLDGAKTTEDSMQVYAASFFLSKLDKQYLNDTMVSESVSAEISVGNIDAMGANISGANVKVDINESVGVRATVKIDKATYEASIMGQSMKFYVGSSTATLSTSSDKNVVFDCDFNASAEMKTFIGGVLYTDTYVKDLNGKVKIATKNTVESLTIGEISSSTEGVGFTASNITYDTEKEEFNVGSVKVSGYYFGYAPVLSIEGTYNDVELGFSVNSNIPSLTYGFSPSYLSYYMPAVTVSAGSSDVSITDTYGNKMEIVRTYDSTNKVITNTVKSENVTFFYEMMRDSAICGLALPTITDSEGAKETYVFDGKTVVRGGFESGSEGSGTTLYPGVIVNNTDILINTATPTLDQISGKAPNKVYTTCSGYYGDYYGTGAFQIGNSQYSLDVKGCALGIAVAADGAVSYSLIALPGFTLTDDMEKAGITLTDLKSDSATVTLENSATLVKCYAKPQTYKITIDGQIAKEDVNYGQYVSTDSLDSDVLYLTDSEGKVVGSKVSEGSWHLSNYNYTSDLNLKSIKGKTVTTVEKDKMNTVDKPAATFVVPTGGEDLQFTMSSKVRFDMSGLTPGATVNLVAEETSYNGHAGFVIKATSGNNTQASTIYIPVSGNGNRLMHVDDLGRVCEIQAENVTIGEDNFLKATVSDYSIFYAEADSSPVVDNGGSGNGGGVNIVLIVVGIVVVAALVAGAVFFVKKH